MEEMGDENLFSLIWEVTTWLQNPSQVLPLVLWRTPVQAGLQRGHTGHEKMANTLSP